MAKPSGKQRGLPAQIAATRERISAILLADPLLSTREAARRARTTYITAKNQRLRLEDQGTIPRTRLDASGKKRVLA